MEKAQNRLRRQKEERNQRLQDNPPPPAVGTGVGVPAGGGSYIGAPIVPFPQNPFKPTLTAPTNSFSFQAGARASLKPYAIQAGDTLPGIGNKLGTNANTLSSFNGGMTVAPPKGTIVQVPGLPQFMNSSNSGMTKYNAQYDPTAVKAPYDKGAEGDVARATPAETLAYQLDMYNSLKGYTNDAVKYLPKTVPFAQWQQFGLTPDDAAAMGYVYQDGAMVRSGGGGLTGPANGNYAGIGGRGNNSGTAFRDRRGNLLNANKKKARNQKKAAAPAAEGTNTGATASVSLSQNVGSG